MNAFDDVPSTAAQKTAMPDNTKNVLLRIAKTVYIAVAACCDGEPIRA
ncbi:MULTISPECIES: hypothetical protein [Pseudomonas]|nr:MULTISPECIES: hypothetical protein [Pseudomonas]MBA6121674.1 hypothetical protein [Pseudomonas juntendi]MBI6914962.1 hypothetical protein [Pseudomonas juntendi]MCF3157481.1 hypothetical protein [Pseudomonas juntendi]MCQ1989938.1 hypothetical protein [Pseudomonas sp. Eb3]MDG9888320.1 hypothetical protein [Pseudomonas juntendi]